MMFMHTGRQETIGDIMQIFKRGNLVIDDTYQRKAVWSEKDKVALVETILLNMVIPELFFWKADIDPQTGESVEHIVDGQQRIRAIADFVSNKLRLESKYLTNNSVKNIYQNKCFDELTAEEKKNFWNYKLLIVDIDAAVNKQTIIEMFQRLNMTDYSLNAQEKRHVKSGDFHVLASELADNEFWDTVKIFTSQDIRRMLDVEYCANIILLYKEGIVNQTNQDALNKAYEDYANDANNLSIDKEEILDAIEQIKKFCCEEVSGFISRKGQLYTLFSWIFYMKKARKNVSEKHIEKFRKFVLLYNKTKIEDDFYEESGYNKILDFIRQYKNASSGGFNSHVNRTKRLNVMKEFLNNDANTECIDMMYSAVTNRG